MSLLFDLLVLLQDIQVLDLDVRDFELDRQYRLNTLTPVPSCSYPIKRMIDDLKGQ